MEMFCSFEFVPCEKEVRNVILQTKIDVNKCIKKGALK